MTTVAAGTQGAAAAEDAVTEATAIGIGTGSPIYFDMEAYSPTTSATKAVLTFLEAWTSKLHELGFQSGVYSSSGSGIADLAAQVSTGYLIPDDIWTANWNNQENTLDPVLPSTAWANHQRIHQFRGGHDDTYGGVTINVDSDYVDGATVGVGTPPVGESDPIGKLEVTGSPAHGPAAGQRLGLRPRRADRNARRQRRGRRPRRRQGRRNLRTRPGRQPRTHRRRRRAQAGRALPRLRKPDRHDQVGAGAGLRLRGQRGARRQPPARLSDDDDPGRGHPLRPDA